MLGNQARLRRNKFSLKRWRTWQQSSLMLPELRVASVLIYCHFSLLKSWINKIPNYKLLKIQVSQSHNINAPQKSPYLEAADCPDCWRRTMISVGTTWGLFSPKVKVCCFHSGLFKVFCAVTSRAVALPLSAKRSQHGPQQTTLIPSIDRDVCPVGPCLMWGAGLRQPYKERSWAVGEAACNSFIQEGILEWRRDWTLIQGFECIWLPWDVIQG